MKIGLWWSFHRNRLAIVGLGVLAFACVLALSAPVLPLADPDATALDARLVPPLRSEVSLGTDHLGRDILARIIWGLRVTLLVGIVATLIAATLGSLLGLIAGYFGGILDAVFGRSIDAMMAFPYLLLALIIVAILGPGLFNALLAVAIVNIPFFARTVRGATVTLSRQPFVDSARMSGMGEWTILFREVLPNVFPVIVITATTSVGWMILETAGLSFLGLGAQPPQADLGSMLGQGRSVFVAAPHVAAIPGVVIVLLVLSINFVGDGLRDALDPHLRSGVLLRPQARTAVESDTDRSAKPSTTTELLQVSGLEVGFDQARRHVTVVDDVGFRLNTGECLGLMGESGCGKSVTALSITALVASPPGRITAGEIWLGEDNLVDLSVPALRAVRGKRIAYVFQDPSQSLNPVLRVGTQIIEAIQAHTRLEHRLAKQRTLDLLGAVELDPPQRYVDRYPYQLSGGQRQRVAIAMALANDPQVLIADEPTSALDIVTQNALLALLRKLREERQMAILLISHDVSLIATLADRMAVMYAGQIIESGPTQELLSRPRHPYTRALLRCLVLLGRQARPIQSIPGEPPDMNDLPIGCRYAPRCPRTIEACTRAPIASEALTKVHLARCIRASESHG